MAGADEGLESGLLGEFCADSDNEIRPDSSAQFSSVSSVGRTPPPSILAIADCVVPMRSASATELT
jgi:hypothetical protein